MKCKRFVSLTNMIEYFFENFNHRMPKTFQICKFQSDFVFGFKLFVWVFCIIVPNVRSSVRNWACIDDNHTLNLKKYVHL